MNNLEEMQATIEVIEEYAFGGYARWKGMQLSDQLIQQGIQTGCAMLESFDVKQVKVVFDDLYYQMSEFVNTEAAVENKFAAAFTVFVLHRYITVHTQAAPLNMNAAVSLVLLCNKYLKG